MTSLAVAAIRDNGRREGGQVLVIFAFGLVAFLAVAAKLYPLEGLP